MDYKRINIRIGLYHFTVSYNWKFGISRNNYHKIHGYPDGYFMVYKFKPFERL